MCHVELSRTAEISPLRSALSACDDVKADLTADISAIRSTLAAQQASFASENAALRDELDGHTSCLHIVHDILRAESTHKTKTFNHVIDILSETVPDYDGKLKPFFADIKYKIDCNWEAVLDMTGCLGRGPQGLDKFPVPCSKLFAVFACLAA